MQVVLGSWKEIANYLGKGVRTVQRWERCNALPVHRPSGSRKGVVLAFPAELDKWARGNATTIEQDHSRVHLSRNTALSMELIKQARMLRESTQQLMDQCNHFLEISKQRVGRTERQLEILKTPHTDARAS